MSRFDPDQPRPRILQCVSHLALGGAERVAVSLIESLQEQYDFSVYAVRGLADGPVGLSLQQQLQRLAVPVLLGPRVPMRFGGVLTGAMGLNQALRRFRPDLVHLHTEIPEASYATLLSVSPGSKRTALVRTIHNSVIWKSWPALGRACDRKLAHARVAGVSQDAVNAFLVLRSTSGATPTETPPALIYNGVRPLEPAPQLTARDSVIRMVYGGRLEPEKGTDLIPEILGRTRLPVGQQARLMIYGSGRHALALRWLERNAPAGWTVEVHEPIPNFSAQLRNFDIAVLPSRHEGLSLVAIEAVLAGIQVVATDASGLREALPSHHPWRARAGDPVSFAATLQMACANRDRWPAISESNRAFALERFAPEKMVAAYDSLYRESLEKTP